jgi:hypothetical protein
VKDLDSPVQPLAIGVTIIVAVIGALEVFVTVNDVIFPDPLAANPIAVLLFTQLYVVPVTEPENATVVVEAPLHLVWLIILLTVGVGFAAIVKVSVGPVQPLAVGVAVITAVCVVVPLFVAVKAFMSPVPLAASPIDVLLLVHA